MKSFRLILTIAAVAALSLLSGCISPPASSDGTAYINGAIRTGPLRKMPPLPERGIHHLGLVMECNPVVGVQTVALTIFGNQIDLSTQPLLSDAEKRGLFLAGFAENATVRISDVGDARDVLLSAVKFNAWNGKPSLARTPAIQAHVDELRAKGIDALLLVYEDRLVDFIGMTSQALQSQGLYRRHDTVAAYGGFHVSVIDLKTFTLLPDAQYTQALSRPFTAVPWKDRLSEYSPSERAAIAEALRDVLRANARQSALVLKAAPAP